MAPPPPAAAVSGATNLANNRRGKSRGKCSSHDGLKKNSLSFVLNTRRGEGIHLIGPSLTFNSSPEVAEPIKSFGAFQSAQIRLG